MIPNTANPLTRARACICSCYSGGFWSGTFRADDEVYGELELVTPEWECAPDDERRKAAIETRRLVRAIRQLIDNENPIKPLQGLVIFSGATKCGKSSLAKAFSLSAIRDSIVQAHAEKGKLPHLVSLEDPIETWSVGVSKSPGTGYTKCAVTSLEEGTENAIKHGFVVTARELGVGKDVATVREGLLDARRQTPQCVFIGEVRNPDEWRDVLEFAGTGHLVVTTTHAASLSETFARIAMAVGADSPLRRRQVINQLVACIHTKPAVVENETTRNEAFLPTRWIRSNAALNGFVADGLSSLNPNRRFVLGRSQFINSMLEMDRNRQSTAEPLSELELERLSQLRPKALSYDILEFS